MFNFGNTSGLGATSTPAKPFGAATTQASAFGTPGFGQTSTFGSPSFGAPTATQAPSFGAASGPSFGATPGPSFGATPGFGASAAAPGFGTAAPGFGAATTSAPGTGFSFGQPTNTGTTSTGFSFGQPTSNTSATTGFSFGQPTASTAPLLGGFGAPASSAGFGLSFAQPTPVYQQQPGNTAQTTSTSSFGGFGTGLSFGGTNAPASSSFSFNAPGFGAQTSTAPSAFGGFGSTFGKPATNTGFGGFGLGQPIGQQPQQQAISPDEAFAQSIFNVSIFDDERDTVIARWNYLQAMWGNGKSFYAKNTPPVDITPQNYLCRFKAIGYNKIPGKDNKIGLVLLNVNKTENDVKNQKDQIIAQLNQIFGNKPNIIVNIDNIEPLLETKTQLTIYIQEKSQISNEIKRITSNEVFNFLNQPMAKSQLTSMVIDEIVPLIAPDEDQLKEYLEKPPKGIDPRMWNQAKQDNPDPKKFIPVPIIGFNELKRRIKCQEKETEVHSLYLAKVQKDLDELKQKHIDASAKILGYKRKLADLSHIILSIIVKQEITRKVGVALSPEEEMLRSKLENMQALISAPTQYKGRLSELLSQMRMQRNQWNSTNTVEYALNPAAAEEMQSFLSMQQNSMQMLIETANQDLNVLKNIHEKISEFVRE